MYVITRWLRRLAWSVVTLIGLVLVGALTLWVLQKTGVLDDPFGQIRRAYDWVTGGGWKKGVMTVLAVWLGGALLIDALDDDNRPQRQGGRYYDDRDQRGPR